MAVCSQARPVTATLTPVAPPRSRTYDEAITIGPRRVPGTLFMRLPLVITSEFANA